MLIVSRIYANGWIELESMKQGRLPEDTKYNAILQGVNEIELVPYLKNYNHEYAINNAIRFNVGIKNGHAIFPISRITEAYPNLQDILYFHVKYFINGKALKYADNLFVDDLLAQFKAYDKVYHVAF